MRRYFTSILCLLALLMPLMALAANVTKVVITAVEPAVGKKCSFKASVPETASSEVYAVSWYGELDNGAFIQGNDYTMTVKLRIKAGSPNIFSTSGNINATINGKRARVTFSRERELTVKYTWKELGGPNPNNPKTILKSKLKEIAASYSATGVDNDKTLLKYLKSQLPNAKIWLAGGSYTFTRRMPTETADGHICVPIGITCDGTTLEGYNFTVVLHALNKSADAINLSSDMTRMKVALQNFRTTAKTTGDEVLAAVNAAAVHGTKAVWDSNYKYNAPTADLMGSIDGNIILALGSEKDYFRAHKVLPIDGTATDAALDADFDSLSKALHNYTVNNNTTRDELINVANAAITHGSKLTVESYSKSDAAYEKEGKIIIYFSLELNGQTRAPRIALRLPKLQAQLPAGISVTQHEWEVLRLTNVERFKEGQAALVMVAPLQDAGNIRAKEIVTDYRLDHRRPDGSNFYTTIDPTHIHPKNCGENANKGMKMTPSEAIASWMRSSGHRANILSPKYSYFGSGVYDKCGMYYYIQLFAIGSGIIYAEPNTGSLTFNTVADMEEAYLICNIGEGIKGYVPLDTDYMTKNGNQYTIHLARYSLTFTVLQDAQ